MQGANRVKAIFRLVGIGAAAVGLVLGGGFTAQAGEQASGTVKLPYESSGVVIGSANLNGPNPPTKFCVTLLASHPYSPAVAVSTTCKTIYAGTVKTKFDHSGCGKYATLATAKVNGKTTYYKQSGFVAICG
jgi:hypothetical protein